MTLYKSCRPLYDAIKLVTNDFDEKRLEKWINDDEAIEE